jgi:hypothetical protein
MKDKKEVEIRFQIDSTMEERIRSSLLQIGWVSGKIMSQTDTGRYPKIKTPFLSPLMIPHIAL